MAFQAEELKPLGDKVLLRRHAPIEETEGGIVIPDNSQETGDSAEVVSVGPGERDEKNPSKRKPMKLKPGQNVLINRYAGTEVTSMSGTYLLVREEDVLAVVS